ncbi:MAG: elongation factor EF-2 [DPANN group archaeon]|nr:elongation factor EF-2 [DPANN group archaeon]
MAKMIDKIKGIVDDKSRIRNLCICAHIDHGKTTLSDNLLSGAGMISEELAGRQLATDFDAQEQERGITIYSANVSMVHEVEGTDYLINLIDTPGHVDFGGDVTRAMRAVDGAVVVACAVDGVMPQTETVLRQALKERVKPVLFINKVDRMIKELQLTPEQMTEKFTSIIYKVNEIIRANAPEEFKQAWQVNVADGKVGFGSAYKNWAISIPFMKKTGMTFKDVIEMTNGDKEKELAKKAPLHNIVLDMAIKHLPTPDVAQAYRIPKLWTGDLETVEGKAMLNCDASGPLAGVITNLTADKHAGMVATARLFSGTLKDGETVRLVGTGQDARVQLVSVYNGPKRDSIGTIPCGNIVGITGIGIANSGETICHIDSVVAPFERIAHIFEPVVTKSIEVKNVKDLPKVISVLRQRSKEDQTLVVKISEETGEMLISGLGELHLEAKVERYFKDLKLDVIVSAPIVIFKEGVKKISDEFEGKSPNKHNKFYFKVEPLAKPIVELLNSGEIKSGVIRKQDLLEFSQKLVGAGFDKDEAKKVLYTYQNNMIVNVSRGVQYLNEAMELIQQGFNDVCNKGPMADEPCFGLKLLIMDAKLHEDAIHRGPAQVLPAVRSAIKEAMINGEASIFEPKQVLRIDTPTSNMGNVMNEVQNRRGQVLNMSEEGDMTVIEAKIPVAEMFGFEASLKSATGGRGYQSLMAILYEIMPKDLQNDTILRIRKRKGLKEIVPTQGTYGS